MSAAAGEELLRLVSNFDELAPGMPVVIKGCYCGATRHRGILLTKIAVRRPDGVAFPIEPSPPCTRQGASGYAIVPSDVAAGVVFRVLDGLDGKRDAREMAELQRAAILRTWAPVSAGYSRESKS